MPLADNQAALVVVLVGSIVVPLAVLAVVLVVAWRSARREDASRED
jgi:hypothetical protein